MDYFFSSTFSSSCAAWLSSVSVSCMMLLASAVAMFCEGLDLGKERLRQGNEIERNRCTYYMAVSNLGRSYETSEHELLQHDSSMKSVPGNTT